MFCASFWQKSLATSSAPIDKMGSISQCILALQWKMGPDGLPTKCCPYWFGLSVSSLFLLIFVGGCDVFFCCFLATRNQKKKHWKKININIFLSILIRINIRCPGKLLRSKLVHYPFFDAYLLSPVTKGCFWIQWSHLTDTRSTPAKWNYKLCRDSEHAFE